MIWAEEILEMIRTYLEDDSIDSEFITFMNFALKQASTMRSWDALSEIKTETVTDGILTMPPRMARLTGLYVSPYDSTVPEYQFHASAGLRTREVGFGKRYTFEPYSATKTAGKQIALTSVAGDQTITEVSGSDFVTADDVGKALMIVGTNQRYEILSYSDSITDTAEVYPAVDLSLTSATGYVTPVGTARVKLSGPDLEVYAGDVEIRYQAEHPKIVDFQSAILIPCPRTLALMTLSLGLQTNKYNVDAQRLQEDLMMAKNEEMGLDLSSRARPEQRHSMFAVRSKREAR